MNAQSDRQDSLFAAVKANNFNETKTLLDKHGLILDDDFSDYKLLIQALCLGNKQIVKLLLDNGCRVFCPQKAGVYSTPLYYAVNLKCFDLVSILLDKGDSCSGKDANKETPLAFAMKNKYFEIVDLMLSKYKIQNKNMNSEDEVTHFHIACMRNKTTLVQSFLEHGMKVDQTSSVKSSISKGYTPLHFAVEHRSVETVELLLSNGANFGLKNANGWTPLHLIFYLKNDKENNKIIDLILNAHLKVIVNPIDTKNGMSHFHIACSRLNLKLLKSFVNAGADLHGSIFSNSSILPGYTPLHIAIEYNCKETVQFLLDHKADVNKAIYTGVTPLHLAVERVNVEIVKLLIQYNADVCVTDYDQNTAIHKAFEENEFSENKQAVLNLLISAHQGKLENVSNKCGVSLFHIACAFSKDPQVVENYLQRKVDINACVRKDANSIWAGFSALNFALENGNLKAIQILLQNNVALKFIDYDESPVLNFVFYYWLSDIIRTISVSTLKLPAKSLNQENVEEEISKRLLSINEHRFQIFELFLKRKDNVNEIYHPCEHLLFFFKIHIDKLPQNEKGHLIISHMHAILKKIVLTLLDYGCDINSKNENNATALHILITILNISYNTSTIELIELLLIKRIQLNIESIPGLTPLMLAVMSGFDDVVDLLLKYNADPNHCTKISNANQISYMAPLHFALSDIESTKVVKLLLAKGAKVNVRDHINNTPLHYAAMFAQNKSMLILLEYDCNVNDKNNEGDTALHIAFANRNLLGIITLLNHGADINLENNCNLTPLQTIEVLPDHFFDPVNFEIFKFLELHLIKLKFIKYSVSKINISVCNLMLGRVERRKKLKEDDVFIGFCKRELERMKKRKIDIYTSLYSIIFKNAHEIARHINNENFKELLNSRELKEQFPLYGYILKLQYKKGFERYELFKPAKDVLQTILNFPDCCYERILASFTNKELEKLAKSR